jgi:hypothetical protein
MMFEKLESMEVSMRRNGQSNVKQLAKSTHVEVEQTLDQAVGKGSWLEGRVKLWRSECNYGFLVVQGYDVFMSGSRVIGGESSIVGATVYAQIEWDLEKGPGKMRVSNGRREVVHLEHLAQLAAEKLAAESVALALKTKLAVEAANDAASRARAVTSPPGLDNAVSLPASRVATSVAKLESQISSAPVSALTAKVDPW